jgi:ribose transport system ATP-binding protein
MTTALHIEHLSKTFPGQVALNDVELEVRVGEVHALVGQNGSGKSTLIKVLAGYHQPDAGSSATAGDEPLELGNARAAAAAGIRFVHQDLGLVDDVSIVENFALTLGYRVGRGRRIRWKAETERAHKALADLGFADLDVAAPVRNLAPTQRAVVAIARALVGWEDGANLLVLDEPTASLPGDDVERLFAVVHRLRERGVSILYVSHHLGEVFELADRVTVLRDAQRVTTEDVSSLTQSRLVELMIGHNLVASTAPAWVDAPSMLHLRGLRGGNLKGADLTVHRGEVVGVAGITGSGREHVTRLVTGQMVRDSGSVSLDDEQLANYAPHHALERGLAFVPSDRGRQGVVPMMSVRENLTLNDVGRNFSKGRLSRSAETEETLDWIQQLDIKTSSPDAPIMSLSGGNQQKVLFGKALRMNPRVLVLDEPTQGIDVGAKDQIHQLIDRAAGDGVAVLVASTDTGELVRLCSRVVVFVDGRIVQEFSGDNITVAAIEQAQLHTTAGNHG